MPPRVLASGSKSCGGNNETKIAKNVTYFRRSELIRLICTTFKLPILIWNAFFSVSITFDTISSKDQ